MSTDRERDVLETKIGRRTAVRLLLAGLAPLVLFALVLSYMTYKTVKTETEETLRDYARLAAGNLFETLDRSRAHLLALSSAAPTERTDEGPFLRVYRRPEESSDLPWPALDGIRRAALARGEVVMTRPYLTGEGTAATVALIGRIPPAAGGGWIAGEIDPEILWDFTRAGNFRPSDRLYVIDEEGRALASSAEVVPFAPLVPGGIPSAARKVGRGGVAGEGGVWAAADVFLTGAFASERWNIVVTRSREAVVGLPRAVLSALGLVGAISLAVLVLFSMQGARRIVRPVTELAAAVDRFENGVWTGLLHSVTSAGEEDELDRLGRAFNRMVERLRLERETLEERVRARTLAFEEAQDRLVRSERLRAIGEMGAGVAHELRNRLTVLAAALYRVRRACPDDPELRRSLESARQEMERAIHLTDSILDFARTPEPRRDRVRLRRLIEEALPLIAPEVRRRGIRLTHEGDVPGEVFCDAGQIQQVLMNVLLNAVQATPDGGSVSIRLAERDVPEDPGVEIVVADTGAGMDSETLARAFEPFFTTKPDGTGLGLAVVRSIVERHGGTIGIESRPGAGTEVRIVLPRDLRGRTAAGSAGETLAAAAIG